MQHVVYILGAGFSAPLGLPVMADFISKAKDLVALDPVKYKHFGEIFETINQMSVVKNYMNQNLHNIEDILSLLEMENFVGRRNIRSKYIRFIKDVVDYYTPKLGALPREIVSPNITEWPDLFLGPSIYSEYLLLVFNLIKIKVYREIGQGYPKFVGFRTDSQEADYRIITLNYDRTLENAIDYLKKNIQFSNAEIELDISKLHGSVDTDIIPPTWNKRAPVPINNAWKRAYDALKSANHIRILGYSLPSTDNHIKYLLSVGLKECENLKTVDVVTLDSNSSTEKRYEDLFDPFPNFRFKNDRIQNYLRSILRRLDGTHLYVHSVVNSNPPNRFIESDTATFETQHEAFMRC